mgnify:CR=1 FL=1
MNDTIYTAYLQSPIGWLKVTGTDAAITSVYFMDDAPTDPPANVPAVVLACVAQLGEYFAGSRREFDLPLDTGGTVFQRRVWQQLRSIPYGKTASYLEIAQAIGNPQAVRAVGAANGSNPVSVILPCHRVIGSNGTLTGYGGGLWRKEWLLKHEGWSRHPQLSLF